VRQGGGRRVALFVWLFEFKTISPVILREAAKAAVLEGYGPGPPLPSRLAFARTSGMDGSILNSKP